MVTMNVKTDQDLANGTRGQIVDIVLDPREREINMNAAVIQLTLRLLCDKLFSLRDTKVFYCQSLVV